MGMKRSLFSILLLCLAKALGPGSLIMGAFDDARVQAVLDFPAHHQPIGLMPVGVK
jgi:hypothetical protein